MTFRRLAMVLTASVTVHVSLGLLLFLAVGVGAGAVLVVDLIAELENPAPAGPASPSAEPDRAGWSRLLGRQRIARPEPTSGAPRSPSQTPRRHEDAGSTEARSQPADRTTAPTPAAMHTARTDGQPPSEPVAPRETAAAPPPAPVVASIEAELQLVRDEGRVEARPSEPAAASVEGRPGPAGSPALAPPAEVAGASRGGSAGPPTGTQGSGPMGEGGAALARAGTGEGQAGGVPPEYDAYLQRFRRRVQESLNYPLGARRRGISGQIELDVRLEPSGRVASVRVLSSSSHGILDDAAVEAVKGVKPEPLPADLPQRPLRIRLPLGFRLE